MRVSLQELLAAQAYLDKINKCPLDKIVWYDNDDEMDVAPELIEEWRFVGLSNVDFAFNHLVE